MLFILPRLYVSGMADKGSQLSVTFRIIVVPSMAKLSRLCSEGGPFSHTRKPQSEAFPMIAPVAQAFGTSGLCLRKACCVCRTRVTRRAAAFEYLSCLDRTLAATNLYTACEKNAADRDTICWAS